MGAQFRISNEHVNAAIAQNVTHLVGLEEVVDRHHCGARVQYAEKRGNKLRTILEPQAHAVAGLDSEPPLELAGNKLGLRKKLRIRILTLAPIQGGLLLVFLHRSRKG